MTVKEALNYLKKQGIVFTESNLYYLVDTYPELKLDNEGVSRLILNPKKVKELAGVLSSPLRITEIVRQLSITYNRMNYILLRDKIPTVKKFGVKMLKNEKDLEHVKSIFC